MSTVCATATTVNAIWLVHRGQPSKQTPPRLCLLNRTLVQALLAGEALPSDAELASRLGIGERTVRAMRLQMLGLNRHDLNRWRRTVQALPVWEQQVERELICATP